MWTQFWDMNSGGGQKEEWDRIYIEAGEEEAKRIFYARFGHNPEWVTCACCGPDYAIDTHESFAQLTGYHRGCRSLETPRDPETGLYRNDDPVIREHRYLEDGEPVPDGYELSRFSRLGSNYMTVEKYKAANNVLCIPAVEIKPEWRNAYVPISVS